MKRDTRLTKPTNMCVGIRSIRAGQQSRVREEVSGTVLSVPYPSEAPSLLARLLVYLPACLPALSFAFEDRWLLTSTVTRFCLILAGLMYRRCGGDCGRYGISS